LKKRKLIKMSKVKQKMWFRKDDGRFGLKIGFIPCTWQGWIVVLIPIIFAGIMGVIKEIIPNTLSKVFFLIGGAIFLILYYTFLFLLIKVKLKPD